MATVRIFLSLIFVVFPLSVSLSLAAQNDAQRHRRSVINFGVMIYCATGRNPFDYNGYGCHCGIGGHGTPVDGVDRCCQKHDRCYNDLKRQKICTSWQLYILHYKTSSPLECHHENSRCGKGLCKCDRDAALCFKARKYNDEYKNYDTLKC